MPFLQLTCDTGSIFGWKSQLDNIPARMRRDSSCSFPDDEEKGKVVRLLLAEGLIEEKRGEITEDVAAKYIDELIVLGMLKEFDNGTRLQVDGSYRKLSICKVEKHDFVTACANSSLRASIRDDGKDIPPNFNGLIIQSLFIEIDDRKCLSGAYMKAICELKFLVVLDLDGKIEYLPDEVGDLVHLRYLSWCSSDLNELPLTIGKLHKLQTLDISWCRKQNIIEPPSIQQLRHLIMSNGEIRVPKEIGTLVNLHTCYGLYAGGGIANELGRLTQLRQLGVRSVAEDHASELAASIVKMVDLISLSLQSEGTIFTYEKNLFPSFEPFSPPPLLQDLCLRGRLVEIPNWVASMENLTKLTLSFSYLSENPTSVLQFLPKLKHLSLWHAYKAKRIGKEFCEEGGFAKLETLTIASDFVVEWTEIENGALSSLKQLIFYCGRKFMFLPEGLQNIFTLEFLLVDVCHNDLLRRLNGAENYKIKHIPEVYIIPPDPDEDIDE